MFLLSTTYMNSVCEIKSLSNILIATGHVSKIQEEQLEITSAPEKLPLISSNKPVKIGIYSSQTGLQILVGKVYLSTPQFMRIVELQSISDYEKREFFRIQVSIPTISYTVLNDPEKPGTPLFPYAINYDDSSNIIVKDVSLSGLLFVSKRKFDMAQPLGVDFPFASSDIFLFRIVRIEQDGDDFEYGCAFAEYSEKQSDLLCSFLFMKQREMIQKSKQYDN